MFIEIVQTIAEVAGALIGFVGVVFVLGKRAVRELTATERSGLFHLLVGSVGTLLLSIVIMILFAALDERDLAWRVGSGLIAIYFLFGATNAIREELRGEHSLPKPFNWILPFAGEAMALSNILTTTNLIEGQAALSCVSGLLLGLIVAITYFISLLTGQYESVGA